MARLMESLVGYTGGEISLNSSFGRWVRYASWAIDNENTAVARGQARSLLLAAGGEIAKGSPLWRYCWRLSELLDSGNNLLREEIKDKIYSSQVGRGAFWDWMWHEYLFVEQ